MAYLLYIIAVLLIIGWAIGFIGYAAGGLIHILLVIAVKVPFMITITTLLNQNLNCANS
jgi:uncharacterized protein DUF5670